MNDSVNSQASVEATRLESSWRRPDPTFFAAGACHVLAAAFLTEHPKAGFEPFLIRPRAGAKGAHVFVAYQETVFDWRGYSSRPQLVEEYFELCGAFFGEGWSAEVIPIGDPISWAFCKQHRHRHPSEFYQSPIQRARAYVRRFPAPEGPSAATLATPWGALVRPDSESALTPKAP
jgi:hypothetical protein